jgi:hypothetical protein
MERIDNRGGNNALEDLQEPDHSTAKIQTDNASIRFEDAQRMYKGLAGTTLAGFAIGGDLTHREALGL